MEKKSLSETIIEEITREKAMRIKKLIEKGFNEDFIMDLYDLNPDDYQKIYYRLYPFGRFTGPFSKFEEQEVKMRILQQIEEQRRHQK